MEAKANPSQPRVAARINPKLEKNLSAYLTAAGAAGVGLMALATPLEAKIIYTPANIQVAFENITPIDLNGDGIADAAVNFGPGAKGILLYASAAVGNGIRLNHNSNAVAGFFGLPTGPGQKFGGSKYAALMYGKSFGYGKTSSYVAFGPWVNVTNRYLGVQFQISGKTHYGWVRMTTGSGGPVITGYAYELTPNTAIKDGAVTSPAKVSSLAPDDFTSPSSQTRSLGVLARGAEGVAIWRREKEAIAS
jgi:hypothetical protein